MRSTSGVRRPERIVLMCLGAVLAEVLLAFTAFHGIAIVTVSRIWLVTSVICTIAGVVGVFRNRRRLAPKICGFGVVVGVVGLVPTVFLEVQIRTSDVYFTL
jgi:drug/metabolite transporter (DMT)-like permease